jgi:glycosyltransferase involved in cell wall biosynthesis
VKFSFLIPSKNRVELLGHAIDSILQQAHDDFEIIVSDNASDDDYAAAISAKNDARIIYRRVSNAVSVTENWNRALELATGDYVLMLGDDDALAPGFISRLQELVLSHRMPDIVYLAAYHYCYPGVMPWAPDGYLADVRNSEFLDGKTTVFTLETEEAHRVAKAAFDFRYLFGFNSQHFLFRNEFLKAIARSPLGSVFQSPYPDTFAATVSFLKAGSIVVLPDPIVMIGISPKSFGYYYYNGLVKEGFEFLDNESVSSDIRDALSGAMLPGDRNNTNWLVAVEEARRALAPEFEFSVNVERYRMLQIVVFLRDVYVKRSRERGDLDELASKLTRSELASLDAFRAAAESAETDGHRSVEKLFAAIDQGLGQFWPAQIRMLDMGKHSSIRDAFNWLALPGPKRTVKQGWRTRVSRALGR